MKGQVRIRFWLEHLVDEVVLTEGVEYLGWEHLLEIKIRVHC